MREDKQDLVCPLPWAVNNSDSESEDEVIQPPVKCSRGWGRGYGFEL